MIFASLYTAWTGDPHPMMPDVSGRPLSSAELLLATTALENMNPR